jgi:glycosyltransferase involved in cell wall biosynthesis
MALPRVLILNYNFPPVGGAATLRGLTLVRRLPSLGYEPVVVTGPGTSFGRWTPSDPTLRDALAGIEVHRLAGPEPDRGARGERVAHWLAQPGAWQRWLEDGFVAAAREVGPVDLVYADLGADATAHAGVRVARERGVPLVVDLGDPWALDEMRVYRTAPHRWVDRRAMRRAFGAADAIVMNTAEAAAAVRATMPELADRPVLALPVGYDAANFAGPEPAPRGDGVFRIVHTGSFHTELAEALAAQRRVHRLAGGGAVQPVDVSTRSPRVLRAALDVVVAEHPELAGRIELHLAGSLTAADRRVLDGLDGVVEHGYLSHEETIALIRSADLLFLPMQDLPEGHRARMVPCKGYEYLASGRPILAAMPDGDGREIFSRAAASTVVRPNDAADMAAAIAEQAALPGAHRASVADERAWLLAGLERAHLNRELARAFDGVLAGRSATTTTAAGSPALTGSTL